MIDLIGQGTAEGMGVGALGTVVLAVLTLLIKRGVTGTFQIGGSKPDKRSHETTCPVHGDLVKLMDERKEETDRHLGLIRTDVTEIKSDVKGLYGRLDLIHSLVSRNGRKAD